VTTGDNIATQLSTTFFRENGIQRRLTITHTPEQNGMAERKNRTLLDMTRCLLFDSGLPGSFWGEAINTANYIRNRCPSKTLRGKNPYEVWTGKIPDVSHLRMFGAGAFTLDRDPTRGKLDSRSKKGILVGYSEDTNGYRIWLPDERKVDVARDVRFFENRQSKPSTETCADVLMDQSSEDSKREEDEVIFSPPVSRDDTDYDEHHDAPDDRDIEEAEEDEVTRSKESSRRGRGRPRIVRTGGRGRPSKQYQIAGAVTSIEEECFVAEISLREAMKGPNSNEWLNAIVDEMRSILRNDTWTMVSRPSCHKVIGNRIVLRNRYRQDGTIDRRKARLVARGFAQSPGIDFMESFAPVARVRSAPCWLWLLSTRWMYIIST